MAKYSDIKFEMDGKPINLEELFRLARLGIWAEAHAKPILREFRSKYISVPWDLYMVRTDAALAALPKDAP